VVQVNTAGEQAISLIPLYTLRRSHTRKLLKNRCYATSKMRYITLAGHYVHARHSLFYDEHYADIFSIDYCSEIRNGEEVEIAP